MISQEEIAKGREDCEREIQVQERRGWGDSRTWSYILLLALWGVASAVFCYYFVGSSIQESWHLGTPGTYPG